MAKLTPQEFAEKWSRKLAASTQDIQRGVERVTEAPGIKAAAQADVMLANITDSVTSGRWSDSVAAVSLGDWKGATLTKGVPRVAPGATAAQPRMARVAAELLPAVDAAAAKANALPKRTLEDSIARATTYMREMANYKTSRR